MKISFNTSNSISFKTSDRKVRMNDEGHIKACNNREALYGGYDKLLYANTTLFFRYDLNTAHKTNCLTDGTWRGFRKTITEHFKDASKVNVYNFASSDGSEAYSFILSLIDELGKEEAQKYFPIHAYDIDTDVVEIAQSGIIPCDFDDIKRFNQNLKSVCENEYYEIKTASQNPIPFSFVAKDNLKKKVQFNVADIQNSIDNIEPSNSLVLCRNFWPYLSKKDMCETIWKLSQKLDESSLLVIGYFDKFTVMETLKICGFEEVCPYIYKKVPNNSF